jgi:DNA-binding FadR family transcriptional regulator
LGGLELEDAETGCDRHELFSDLYHLRQFLEVRTAEQAASGATIQDITDLRRIITEMNRPALSEKRKIDLDMHLHFTVARAAGSAVNLYLTEALRNFVIAYFKLTLTDPNLGGRREALFAEHHRAIVSGISARDPSAARAAMAEHCRTYQFQYEAMQIVDGHRKRRRFQTNRRPKLSAGGPGLRA